MKNKKANSILEVRDEKKGWEAALYDAEAHLADARKNLYEWKAIVRACKKKIEAGEPWPGERK